MKKIDSENWVFIETLNNLPPNTHQAYTIDGENILLYRSEDKIYAIENFCSHQGFPLTDGCVIEDKIRCSFHGAQFCLKTGAVLEGPAMVNLKTYSARVNGADIEVLINSFDRSNRACPQV